MTWWLRLDTVRLRLQAHVLRWRIKRIRARIEAVS